MESDILIILFTICKLISAHTQTQIDFWSIPRHTKTWLFLERSSRKVEDGLVWKNVEILETVIEIIQISTLGTTQFLLETMRISITTTTTRNVLNNKEKAIHKLHCWSYRCAFSTNTKMHLNATEPINKFRVNREPVSRPMHTMHYCAHAFILSLRQPVGIQVQF